MTRIARLNVLVTAATLTGFLSVAGQTQASIVTFGCADDMFCTLQELFDSPSHSITVDGVKFFHFGPTNCRRWIQARSPSRLRT